MANAENTRNVPMSKRRKAQSTVMERAILAGKIRAGMTFNEKVWALCARVPAGRVTTYGEIAKAAGQPGAARAVGNAMNRNPYAPTVPCHRVVGSTGKLTGFAQGLKVKAKMLRDEGVAVSGRTKDRVDLSDVFRY